MKLDGSNFCFVSDLWEMGDERMLEIVSDLISYAVFLPDNFKEIGSVITYCRETYQDKEREAGMFILGRIFHQNEIMSARSVLSQAAEMQRESEFEHRKALTRRLYYKFKKAHAKVTFNDNN